jgi:PBP1b-binding outer membrane lipoprotein LpoB
MTRLALILAAALTLAGCVSGSGSDPVSREPNYVQSQMYQSPTPRNDTFGGGLPSSVGLPN